MLELEEYFPLCSQVFVIHSEFRLQIREQYNKGIRDFLPGCFQQCWFMHEKNWILKSYLQWREIHKPCDFIPLKYWLFQHQWKTHITTRAQLSRQLLCLINWIRSTSGNAEWFTCNCWRFENSLITGIYPFSCLKKKFEKKWDYLYPFICMCGIFLLKLPHWYWRSTLIIPFQTVGEFKARSWTQSDDLEYLCIYIQSRALYTDVYKLWLLPLFDIKTM